ncbi:DEAD/DEAH box helicase [Rhodopseudomonas pseudopalustris]|uniref:SNF2 family N-terminal domain-containing protein n=1 Tax=Rhodopseudomonas pseudopalustris TaxID=1513892 RepID=A0A1H8WGX5_9BRAD|nr:DEAD/DEAH box helicase [Rhodopseudomonas pseudopalustris]SEP26900.1 SNF2 family N-terminal domain-containing protein [Rhodopseudomonas pseudopalustris]
MKPLPTQLSGSLFLARNANALLADAPRVGKTGTAIIGADLNLEQDILVITTASGRPVWRRSWPLWSDFGRPVRVLSGPPTAREKLGGVTIVGWGQVSEPAMRAALMSRDFDRAILDESHAAKSFDAKRTAAVYGDLRDDGQALEKRTSITARAAGVWCLSGSPLPHDPSDAYPMLRALAPERLAADPARGWPDVTRYSAFESRYCIVRKKKTSQFRRINVVVGGRNTEELNARLKGFMLRRTQADVGIRPPVYELLPLMISGALRQHAEGDVDRAAILKAIDEGRTRELEMHLGPLRRNTGALKARAVVDAVKDEFDGGLDKIVLMYWHKEVGDALQLALEKFGVLRLDGSTPPAQRGPIEQAWLHDKSKRVFLGQIVAAGEAIDLSSAALLWFVEQSFTPKDMQQASLRITNHNQARQAVVRVCVIEGSIDEAIQASLMRLWAAIREVLG